MKATIRHTLLASGAALLLIGCGGGGEKNPTTEEPTLSVAPPPGTGIIVCITDPCPGEVAISLDGIDFSRNNALVIDTDKERQSAPGGERMPQALALVPKSEQKVAPYMAIARAMSELDPTMDYPEAKRILEALELDKPKMQKALIGVILETEDAAAGIGLNPKDAEDVTMRILARRLLALSENPESYTDDLNRTLRIREGGRTVGAGTISEIIRGIMVPDTGTQLLQEVAQEAISRDKRVDPKSDFYHFKGFVKKYQCKENSAKHFLLRGIPDAFSPLGAQYEVPAPQGYTTTLSYDSHAATSALSGFFADTIGALPSNITQGEMLLSLRKGKSSFNNGDLNYYFLGDFANFAWKPLSTLMGSWNHSSTNTYLYHQALSQIHDTATNATLLQEIQNGMSSIDFAAGVDTDVNYMAVVYCEGKKKPPVDTVPPQVHCNAHKGEYYVSATFGHLDGFRLPEENTTPSATLLSLLPSSATILKYDTPVRKRAYFVDTLDLTSAIGGGTVTQAKVLVTTRPSPLVPNTLPQNDAIYLGKAGTSYYLYHDPNDNAGIPTLGSGMTHIIDGSTNIVSYGSLLTMIDTEKKLDLLVFDQTQVDMARVDMCIVDQKPEKRDINLSKKLVEVVQGPAGNALLTFQITAQGSLATGESIVVDDIVPQGTTLTSYNANGWNCTPAAPIAAGSTLSCSITGAINPIPPISVTLSLKDPKQKVENCAAIVKGIHTDYNYNPENDKACDLYIPDVNDTHDPLPKECSEEITLDLSQSASWTDANGNHPTVHNVFAGTQYYHVWDPSLSWFDFGSAGNTDHILTIPFCSCGGGEVIVNEMKSDNEGYVYLDDPNSGMIVQRTAHSQITMGDWGPNVNGTLSFAYSGNGVDHNLTFKVHNHYGPSGGAIDGTLRFVGHLGACTQGDVLP